VDLAGLPPSLTPALAQEIAGDTSEIIGFNVLLTDCGGMVIGSGDRSRVGSFHEASVDVVRTIEAATHDAAQARRLRGVRPGITLPIVVSEATLGTIGITGSPAHVRRFGPIVRRQAEILVQGGVALCSGLQRERALEDLVRDIVCFDAETVDPKLIAYRAGELGYDLGVPRVVVVVDLLAPPSSDQSTTRVAFLNTLPAAFVPAYDVVAASSSVTAVIVSFTTVSPLIRSYTDLFTVPSLTAVGVSVIVMSRCRWRGVWRVRLRRRDA
jgi:carbohydrate diacid regulator